MKYDSPAAFRQALEARLRAAASAGQDLARRRRTVAFDRLLARLTAANHDGWLLKGGAALEFRIPDRARSTRDIDLALNSGDDPADRFLDDIEGDPFGDHFTFSVTRRRTLAPDPGRGAVIRLSVDAHLAGRPFERFVVDLVSRRPGTTSPDTVELGRTLASQLSLPNSISPPAPPTKRTTWCRPSGRELDAAPHADSSSSVIRE